MFANASSLICLIMLIEMNIIKSYFVNSALDEIKNSKLSPTRLKVHYKTPTDSKLTHSNNVDDGFEIYLTIGSCFSVHHRVMEHAGSLESTKEA